MELCDDDGIKSPVSEQNCNCSSCWHCCVSKNVKKSSDVLKTHNMTISLLYLLCFLTGASSLAISFWLGLTDVHWVHIFMITLISPAFVGFGLFLGCKSNWSENTQSAKALCYGRSYIIAVVPCCLAAVALDALRIALYIETNRNITDIVFINLKFFYIAFQVVFLIKYVRYHIAESLCSRLFLMHLIGTNIFLWFHEFSVHSTRSLEFLRNEYSKLYVQKGKLILKIIDSSEPYVYPLVIQFMIIASAASFHIWLNVRGLEAETQDIYIDDDYTEMRGAVTRRHRTVRYVAGPLAHSEMIEANVETSEKHIPLLSCGLVIGSFSFVGLVFSALLLLSQSLDHNTALTVYHVYQSALFVCMISSCVTCLAKMSQEQIPTLSVGGLDILILVPMLGYLLYAEFSGVASFSDIFDHRSSAIVLFLSIAKIIQAALQSIIITKAYRNELTSSGQGCCSFVPNALMFLLFSNAGLWISESIFDLRISFVTPVQCRFYGSSLWEAIKFALYPLCVLFRFTSCSSLLEILLWSDEF